MTHRPDPETVGGSTWVEDPAHPPHRIFGPGDGQRFVVGRVDGKLALAHRGRDGGPQVVDLATGARWHHRAGWHPGWVSALTYGRLGDLEVVVSGGADGRVLVRDAVSGEPLHVLKGQGQGRDWEIEALRVGQVDGRSAVFILDAQRSVRVWDPLADVELIRWDNPRAIAEAGFADRDGRVVMLTRTDGDFQVRDVASGVPVGASFTVDSDYLGGVGAAFGSVDGRLVVALTVHEHPVHVWDAVTAAPLGPPIPENLSGKRCLAFGRHAGRTVLFIGHGHSVQVGNLGVQTWDPHTGARVPGPFDGHDDDVQSLTVGEFDGRSYAVVGNPYGFGSALFLRGPSTSCEAIRLDDDSRSFAFARIGNRPTVLIGGFDGTERLVNLDTGTESPHRYFGPPTDTVLAFGEVDGRATLLLEGRGWLRLWDVVAGLPSGPPQRIPDGFRLFSAPDGQVGASAIAVTVNRNAEERAGVWDRATRQLVDDLAMDDDWIVVAATRTRIAGRAVALFAVNERRESFVLWSDAATGEQLGSYEGHGTDLAEVAVGDVGGRPVVASGDHDGVVRLWYPGTGEDVAPPCTGHTDRITTLAFGTMDGRTVVASGSDDTTVRVWDASSGDLVAGPFAGHGDEIMSVLVTEFGGEPVVVSGAQSGPYRMWSLRAPAVETGHLSAVTCLASGTLRGRAVFASGSTDRTIRLWDAGSGEPVGAPLTGHTAAVNGVAVVETDGVTVVLGIDAHGTLLRWDAAAGTLLGDPQTGLEEKVGWVTTVAYDGRTLVACPVPADGATLSGIRLWDAVTGAPYCLLECGPAWRAALAEIDGRLIAAVVGRAEDGDVLRVSVWDVRSGQQLHEPYWGIWEEQSFVALTTVDGRWVVVLGEDYTDWDERDDPSDEDILQLRDLVTLERLDQTFDAPRARAVLGSYDGRPVLAEVSEDRVHLSALTGEHLGSASAGIPVSEVAMAEVDGRTAVAISADATVHIVPFVPCPSD
ncbi:WD40 repeat domain-containing protein [Cryptosporangium aurantiacum]|uniref:WD40 repeat n=1 Tax=Cryptosporangium aurantiacum TaxID=134849 RepID=A0A1M7Q255_9ACTN|nr:WD40 repeat domain-containing protein [Cryptosporangium aurantiacum]SHN24265.1 WD40 repeat [Cryptosporangium aurantiacum]